MMIVQRQTWWPNRLLVSRLVGMHGRNFDSSNLPGPSTECQVHPNQLPMGEILLADVDHGASAASDRPSVENIASDTLPVSFRRGVESDSTSGTTCLFFNLVTSVAVSSHELPFPDMR